MKLVTVLAFSLLAIIGVTLLLLGVVFLLEPVIGIGAAYTSVGGLVTASSLVGAFVVHRSKKSSVH